MSDNCPVFWNVVVRRRPFHQNTVMDQNALLAELKAVAKGRGVRRPMVQSWIGPLLATVSGVDANMSDEDARNALVAVINRHAQTLPVDLRWILATALGIRVDMPRLTDRCAEAQVRYQVSDRTIRRKLREAEQMVADALAHADGVAAQPLAADGWQWVRQHFDVTLGRGAQFELRRRLRVLAERATVIEEAIALPTISDGSEEVGFTPGEGIAALQAVQRSPQLWSLTLELSHELQRGEELDTTLGVWISDVRRLQNYVAVMPVRTLPAISVRVDFGTPPVAQSAWRIDDHLPIDLHVRPPGAEGVDPEEAPTTLLFERPRLGFGYGIGWDWTE